MVTACAVHEHITTDIGFVMRSFDLGLLVIVAAKTGVGRIAVGMAGCAGLLNAAVVEWETVQPQEGRLPGGCNVTVFTGQAKETSVDFWFGMAGYTGAAKAAVYDLFSGLVTVYTVQAKVSAVEDKEVGMFKIFVTVNTIMAFRTVLAKIHHMGIHVRWAH